MYNQVNRGPHSGQGSVPPASLPPPPPLPPNYQQALPPPPPHFQHFVPPPAPHVYLHGSSTSSTVPLNAMPNTGPSYGIPPRIHHGGGMGPQTFPNPGQNLQRPSNLGVQSHPIPVPVPPPIGHSHQETSWAPSRVLPPPPPPPSSSQGQILYNHLPPPPPHPFRAPNPGGVYHHSTVSNYQVPSVAPPPPPLPTSPPPVLPSPPPPTPLLTRTSSQATCSDDPGSMKVSGFESKAVDSVDGVVASCPSSIAPVRNYVSYANQDGGSCGEVAVAHRDELLPTRSVTLDLPPPPPRPAEEKTVQSIEALCQSIAENGADIEDKVRRDEYQNPEYAFLFGGDPRTEAAIAHTYFLWMKKKYNIESRSRWHAKNTESQLKSLTVDTSGKQYRENVATISADSDMEMEDDITLSDTDQVSSNHATEVVTQQHHEVFSTNEKIEDDPGRGISSTGVSCFGSAGDSIQNEGPGLLSDMEHMRSARSVTAGHSPVNNSTEVAESPLGTVLGSLATPLDEDFRQNGTSDHNEATNTNRDVGQLMQSGSPIRLLQEYASDQSSDNEDEGRASDANVFTISAGADPGVSAAHKDSESYLETDIGTKCPSGSQKGLVQESEGTWKISDSRTNDGCVEHNHENQVSVNFSSPLEAFQRKDSLGGTGFLSGSKSGNAEHGDERKTSKLETTVLKVDEFGRHLREGAADSDSDDSHGHRSRRMDRRDKSRSRSRSPLDRKSRRRRSLPRRKDRRSRSRSWSPRQRRSRSRSPIARRSSDAHGDIMRRDKGQCFDFLRGKCYRGASCRFTHHESDKNATSRRSRKKHDGEVYFREKSSRIDEGMKNISSEVSDYEHDRVRNQNVDQYRNVTGQEVVQRKEDSDRHSVVSTTFDLEGQLVNSNPSSEGFREVAPKVQETFVVGEEPKTSIIENDSFHEAVSSHQQHMVDGFHPEASSSGDASKPSGGTSKDVIPSVQQLKSNVSIGCPEHSGHPSQLLNVSCVTDLSSDKIPMISADEVSGNAPLPYMLPSTQLQSAPSFVDPCVTSEQPSLHSQTSKELPPPSGSLMGIPPHIYPLPASVSTHSQGEKAVHMSQISRPYGVMQQNAFFPFQSTTNERFEPCPAPLLVSNSQFSVPPNNYWTSLPPPPPPPSQAVHNSSSNLGAVKSFVTSQCNQSQLHSRTDYAFQTSMNPGLPTHSQNPSFEDQAYPPMLDHSRTFMLTEPSSSKHLPQGNPASQSLSGPILIKVEHHNQLSMQDSKFSSSTPFDGLQHQPKQFSRESDANRPQPFLSGKFPPEEHFRTSSYIHPLSQQQPSVYNLQYSSSDINLSVPGGTATVSRYPPDVLDSNHSTPLLDVGGSRISAHYNPYASTFEQPLSSKFNSNYFRQENDIIRGNNYGSSSSNYTITREADGDRPRQNPSSPKLARAVSQSLPRSGGEQYDPLFDSIEPSSSLKKFDSDQKQEVTGESNVSLRPKSSFMSLDIKEKKDEEVEPVPSTSSQNNDEYGETADAEVGAVENESLSDHVDTANMTPGEMEINQLKSPGKRKKSKDSRSMKLFKVSIANFVKDVLKPSWRQGNMSKVAFKTIVKKTVDKVSGAMKGHRMPKSQAKISQYIDSSQRKLTKLVMGYVDKYVKV